MTAVVGRMRRAASSGLLAVLAAAAPVLLLACQPAFGHADVPIVDGTILVAPGKVVEYPLALHFHRLVGRYRLHDPAATGLSLLLVDGEGPRDGVGATAQNAAFITRLGAQGTVNHLIECCLGTAYSGYRLLLRNDGATPVALDLRAWAVHDDFAVVAHRAETGALEVPLLMFLALVIAATAVALRERRRSSPATADGATGRSSSPRLPSAFWGSLGLFLAAGAVALGLGTAGAVRYRAGLVDGMIAIMADLPVPGGLFGSRDAFVMGVLMLSWVAAIALWIRTVHLGAHRVSLWPGRLGIALGLVSIAAGIALGLTYGHWIVPVGLGLVLGAPLVAIASRLHAPRRAARGVAR